MNLIICIPLICHCNWKLVGCMHLLWTHSHQSLIFSINATKSHGSICHATNSICCHCISFEVKLNWKLSSLTHNVSPALLFPHPQPPLLTVQLLLWLWLWLWIGIYSNPAFWLWGAPACSKWIFKSNVCKCVARSTLTKMQTILSRNTLWQR